MAYVDPPEDPQPRVSSALLMGAASPLWGYFGAVAAGGMAYWWMTRWTRPMNLEALFEAATSPALALVPPEPVVEAVVEAMTEPFQAPECEAVGGEAAPLSPIAVETLVAEPVALESTPLEAAAPAIEPQSEPVLEAAPEVIPEPEPLIEAAPKPAVDPAPETAKASEPPAVKAAEAPAPAPRPKTRKAAPTPTPDTEA